MARPPRERISSPASPCGTVTGRRSGQSLYSFDLATYDTGDTFDQTLAKGFVRLHGLSSQIANKRDREQNPAQPQPQAR